MTSEPEGRQDSPDPVWSKAPENTNDSASAPETAASKDAQIRAGTEQSQTGLTLPILPIRGLVLFPGMIVPLTIGRPSALKLVDSELPENKNLGLVTQRDEQLDHPEPSALFRVGVSAQVVKLIRQPDGVVVLIVQVLRRIALESFVQTEPYLRAVVQSVNTVFPEGDDTELQASFNNLRRSALKLLELSPEIPDQARAALIGVEQPEQLTDLLAGNLGVDLATKQRILEEPDLLRRMRITQEALQRQLEIAELQQKLRKDVEGKFSDTQRRAYLREQLKAIQRELGEEEADGEEQADQLRKKLQEAGANETVMAAAEKELKRLSHIPSASPEYSVIVSYVEMLADLPWNKSTDDHSDLERAQTILDRDHYGLEKVKRRIVEFLAVRKLNPGGKSPILCFVGPPGVGKTSLGQSIARATGRVFQRVALGGVHDEAEIRGHRRTYIGALPGNIIQAMRRAGTTSTVLMLDEIDKTGAGGFHGDPASALLEVLDPEQNHKFRDNYLAVDFDLSRVMFICTANVLDTIPGPLRDRMEIIQLPGYTEEEKIEIARRYLVKRQLDANGLKPEQASVTDAGLAAIVRDYTREAGVRNLEREIGSVLRHAAMQIAEAKAQQVTMDAPDLPAILGPRRYENELALRTSTPGVATGLAWTPVGGDILFIEASKVPGSGRLILTGQLGEVMKESAQAALTLAKTWTGDSLEKTDVHVHVPAGATPKDGPSAGVAMFLALVSLLTGKPVRADVAMTGEISLRGLVLPIG